MTQDATGRARRALLAATAPIAPLLIIASALTMPPGTDTISDSKAASLALLATVSRHRDKTAPGRRPAAPAGPTTPARQLATRQAGPSEG